MIRILLVLTTFSICAMDYKGPMIVGNSHIYEEPRFNLKESIEDKLNSFTGFVGELFSSNNSQGMDPETRSLHEAMQNGTICTGNDFRDLDALQNPTDMTPILGRDDADFNEFDPRYFPNVELNEAERKLIDGNGPQLKQDKEEYERELNKPFRALNPLTYINQPYTTEELKRKIATIDGIDQRFREDLIKDFYAIRHGNTYEAACALNRLRTMQSARSRSPSRPRYNPKGLLLNQYKIGYSIAASCRHDGNVFPYQYERVGITQENVRQRMSNSIVLTQQQCPDFSYMGEYSVDLLKIMHDKKLFVTEDQLEFKQIFASTVNNFIGKMIEKFPTSDRKLLIINASNFCTALLCNTMVPGSAKIIFGFSTAAGYIRTLYETNWSNAQSIQNTCANIASDIATEIVTNKITDNLVGTINNIELNYKNGTNVYKHKFKYDDRLLNQRKSSKNNPNKVIKYQLEDRQLIEINGPANNTYHDFPYSFDDVILSQTPTKNDNGGLWYRLAGTINGKDGFFELGVNPLRSTIVYRRFVENKK